MRMMQIRGRLILDADGEARLEVIRCALDELREAALDWHRLRRMGPSADPLDDDEAVPRLALNAGWLRRQRGGSGIPGLSRVPHSACAAVLLEVDAEAVSERKTPPGRREGLTVIEVGRLRRNAVSMLAGEDAGPDVGSLRYRLRIGGFPVLVLETDIILPSARGRQRRPDLVRLERVDGEWNATLAYHETAGNGNGNGNGNGQPRPPMRGQRQGQGQSRADPGSQSGTVAGPRGLVLRAAPDVIVERVRMLGRQVSSDYDVLRLHVLTDLASGGGRFGVELLSALTGGSAVQRTVTADWIDVGENPTGDVVLRGGLRHPELVDDRDVLLVFGELDAGGRRERMARRIAAQLERQGAATVRIAALAAVSVSVSVQTETGSAGGASVEADADLVRYVGFRLAVGESASASDGRPGCLVGHGLGDPGQPGTALSGVWGPDVPAGPDVRDVRVKPERDGDGDGGSHEN